MSIELPRRIVRSFVRRQGRLTGGQQRALELFWPKYGVEAGLDPLDLDALFGRRAPRTLEIGFGNGASLAAMAAARPEHDFLGIEVHRPGVGQLLMRVEELELSNVRVMCTDAVEVLKHQITDASLDAVLLFFPDPWHKTCQQKRRVVQVPFIELVKRKLALSGHFHMATDWEHYANHALSVLSSVPGLQNRAAQGDFVARPAYRPVTKFEQRGHRLGHGVWDLIFDRTS